MAAKSEAFGKTADGESVTRIGLQGGRLSINILTWGAVTQDLRLEDHAASLVLGFENFEDYPKHSPYFGAIAGRVANRITQGRFEIDGKSYQVDTNFQEKHTLHGGAQGIGKRNWQIADLGTSHVILTLDDPDGAMGFPGNCKHTCAYTLKDDSTLHIALTTTTDAPTIVNLAPHSYFTLNGAQDCRNHALRVDAEHYLPINDDLIPTGVAAPVAETAFDFRTLRFIGDELDGTYDHNFCLTSQRRPIREVAQLRDDENGLAMTVATTEPGLQIYTGSKLNVPAPGLDGATYGAFAGIAMEPQLWPDAPNHEGFPDAVLRPAEESRQVSTFRFEKG